MAGLGGGLVALAVWAWVRPDLPAAWWLLLIATAALAAWAWWGGRHIRRGKLVWGGADLPAGEAGWRWVSAARPRGVALDAVRTVLDLGGSLLIAARTPDGLTLWLWCRADAGEPADWLALRRALAAHADGHARSGIFRRPLPTHDG